MLSLFYSYFIVFEPFYKWKIIKLRNKAEWFHFAINLWHYSKQYKKTWVVKKTWVIFIVSIGTLIVCFC